MNGMLMYVVVVIVQLRRVEVFTFTQGKGVTHTLVHVLLIFMETMFLGLVHLQNVWLVHILS